MRRNLIITLLIFLFIGGCDLNCGKGPTSYWEIETFTIFLEKFDGVSREVDIEESSYDDLEVLLRFELSKVASIRFNTHSLYALDCSNPTFMRNSITSIEVTTVFDINSDYLAGANINEIVTLGGYSLSEIAQFDLNTEVDFYRWVELKVEEIILPDREFSLDITFELSDGKVLNKISSPIRII